MSQTQRKRRKADTAASKARKIEQRDRIVGTKMRALDQQLKEAADTRVQDHLKKVRHRDLMNWAAQDMGILERLEVPQPCYICLDELASPIRLPCQGGHQFCETCIVKTLEESTSEYKTCPCCRGDVDEWYAQLKQKICKKELKVCRKKVRKAIVAAEKEVGIKRKWYQGGPSEMEVWKAMEAWA